MTDTTCLLSRRRLCLAGAALLAAGPAVAAPREITVYKTPWCGCCKGWITHLTRAGFRAKTVEVEDLAPIRQKHGIPFRLSSCHTGEIAGYFVEGHVPIADVQRLLRERPKALGLTVPGMPLGSPGMESRDGAREAYETLLVLDRKGTTRVFARHG
ncbi:DUF411 domain-containing protein [Phenylobacterium sp. J426]|uniref:DUF411 domain-containing protein n=1 Tax=Phenylobacterium sp. J426 TaxID=2898439 RepID=UPI00215197D6|nr:DUF411 domain-containing protein [Phenylobacterium sp. J426]MCR5872778.1 DUF411 domain-containing protein [Phenylobacterium sp. J426]